MRRYLGGDVYKYQKRFLFIVILVLVIFWLLREVNFVFLPLLVLFSVVLMPLAVSLVVYYISLPFKKLLEGKFKMNSTFSSIVLLVGWVSFIAILLMWVGPVLKIQVVEFTDNIPKILKDTERRIIQIDKSGFLDRFGLSLNVDMVVGFLHSKVDGLVVYLGEHMMSIIGGITKMFMVAFMIPFLTFYILKDGNKFSEKVLSMVGDRYRGEASKVIKEMDKQLGSYIQGQLLVSLFVGIMIYLGLSFVGLKYALLLACICFLTNFVPFLGPIIGSSPALLIGLLHSPIMFLKVLLIILVVQQLESLLVSPQVMGRKLKVHPLTVIILLLVAGRFFGFLGMLFGLPVYVLLKVVIVNGFRLVSIKRRELKDRELSIGRVKEERDG